jgi:hypothetical protein
MSSHACFLTGSVLLAATCGALAQGEHATVHLPPVPGDAPRVITVAVDLADIVDAMALAPSTDWAARARAIRAAMLAPDGTEEPIPCQCDLEDGAAGTLALWVEPSAQPRDVALYLDAQPAGPAPAAPEAVSVDRTDTTVTVRQARYSVTHGADQAWLPERIEWTATGKVFDSFVLNDRLHHPDRGGWLLRQDRAAKVEVLGRGPLRAAVRVTAHYCGGDGTRAEGEPQAVYTFEYVAGAPEITVHAEVTQQRAVSWTELHVLEINFPDQSLTGYSIGVPEEDGELVGDEKSHRGYRWAALTEGENVLALVGEGGVIYDGRGGYGTYLHGPWLSLEGVARSSEATLLVDAGPGALAEARGDALPPRRKLPATVSVPALDDALAAAADATAELPEGAERARGRWLIGLVRGLTGSMALS